MLTPITPKHLSTSSFCFTESQHPPQSNWSLWKALYQTVSTGPRDAMPSSSTSPLSSHICLLPDLVPTSFSTLTLKSPAPLLSFPQALAGCQLCSTSSLQPGNHCPIKPLVIIYGVVLAWRLMKNEATGNLEKGVSLCLQSNKTLFIEPGSRSHKASAL